MTTGERIKAARKKAGMTQKQLGILSQTSEITIRQYELGKRQPRTEQLSRIAIALNVTVDYLVNGEERQEVIPGRLWVIRQSDTDSKYDRYKIEAMDKEAYDYGLSIFENAGFPAQDHIPAVKLMDAFYSLNDVGQLKAVERVEELVEIPKYQKSPAPGSTQDGGEDQQ